MARELQPAAVVDVRRRPLLLYDGDARCVLLAPGTALPRSPEAADTSGHDKFVRKLCDIFSKLCYSVGNMRELRA